MKKTDMTGLEIAVIGYAGKFNNCSGVQEYWTKLRDGMETFDVFKDDELQALGIPKEIYRKENYIPVRGNLSEKDCFDARFFGYTPDEAHVMDPQIRIFHEVVWQGLEMAGYAPGKNNQRIGLYASASDNAIWPAMMSIKGNNNAGGFETAYLSSNDYLCSLISYKLNLKGPAVFIQTACSSSLVAVHQAVRAILTGDCDMAIAGGVSVSLLDKGGYLYQENLIYSPDGHCRAFDAEANGTLKGEGGGVVILKKYQDAIRDRDTIYAVIKGSAINNDGNEKMGFTAPGVNGQRKVIRHALQIANVDPDSVSYIETHGTGTRLGDPVEFKALCEAYGPSKKIRAAIGSVKTNIGHLDSAAGIASLIKVLLMIQHRQIPASLHFTNANPEIDFDKSPFYVNNILKEWVADNGLLRAGVSSFGIGGTNCHMIVEEAPAQQLHELASGKNGYIVNLSAKTSGKLNEICINLGKYLSGNPAVGLPDLSYTLNTGRYDFNHRQSVIAHTIDELKDKLKEQNSSAGIQIKDKETFNRSLVFVFSGQGAQYRGMGRELYNRSAFFRARMQEVFSLVTKYNNIVLEDVLFSEDETDKRINETLYAQLALLAVSYATASLLKRMGIEPAALIGHSIGEYTAAVIAEMITLEEAVRIIGRRALLMQGAEAGMMYTVFAGEQQIKEMLTDEVSIAAVNSPDAVVVSGNNKAIEKLIIKLTEKNILFRRLHTSHAFHSPMMDNIRQEYRSFLDSFTFRKGKIPVVSNITGKFFETVPAADYWSNHLRETVRFSDGINTLRETGYTTFIEVGPGNQLIRMIGTVGEKATLLLENTIRPATEKADDYIYFIQNISRLWQEGLPVDWSVLYEGEMVKKISLPAYPFDSIHFPLQINIADLIGAVTGTAKPVLNAGEWLYKIIWSKENREPVAGSRIRESGCILVFCDDAGYADQITSRLNTTGSPLIKVKHGNEYNKLNEYNYQVNLFDAVEYNRLLESIRNNGHNISIIIHCLNLGDTQPSFDDAVDAAYLSLCYIAQALSKCRFENNIQFRILVKDAVKVNETDNIDPLKAMAIGAAKIISVEYDNLLVRIIDMNPADVAQQGFGLLLNEALFDNADNLLIACRGTNRYVPDIAPVNKLSSDRKTLRKDGCYVITGGLGGMGLAIAADMAARERVRIALISRRRFVPKDNWDNWLQIHGEQNATSKIILKLKSMELKGASVMVISADVADFMQMRGAITRIEKEFGKINGIIWAAGVIDYEGIIQRRSKEQLVKNISSKVNGILIAEQLINCKELDWLVLFSSIGNLYYHEKFGQVAYNVANEFLDAYAQSQPDLPISAISWCDWKEVGMSFNGLNNKGATTEQINDILKDALSEAEGVEAFWQCVESGCKNVMVSKKDLVQKGRFEVVDSAVTTAANHPASIHSFERPELSTPYEAPSTPLEHFLAALCCDLFGISQVGVNDNFLELGGDSLKAVHYINRIKKEKKLKVTLEDFFSYPTIAGLAAVITSRLPAEACALLPAQNRMFIISRLEPEQTSYNQVFVFRTKPIAQEKLQRVAHQLLKIHQALRACFIMVNGSPVQKFMPDVRTGIDVYNIGNDNEIAETARRFERPFDLSVPPLFRIGYVNNKNGMDYLMIDLHHIISDGISNQVFLNDMALLLADKDLVVPQSDFKTYIEWFNTPEVQEEIRQEETYWLERFGNFTPNKGLPTDHPRKPVDSRDGGRFTFSLPSSLTQQVIELEKGEKVTPYVFNLSVLYILLYKLTGDEDSVIGSAHFGRDYQGFEKVMGMFIETLALRNPINGKLKFLDFLRQVARNTYRDFDKRKYPFESLVERLNIPANRNRNPLFDVVLSSVDLGPFSTGGDDGIESSFEYIEQEFVKASFDILLNFSAAKGTRNFCFDYNANLFKRETIMSYASFIQDIMQQVVNVPSIAISDINLSGLLWEKAFHNPVYSGVISGANSIQHVLQQISAVAANNGNSIAVVDGTHQLSYAQLMEEADKLAVCLMEQYNIGEQDRVAIYLERSTYFVIAVLAVMKIRSVFVPIDVSMPEQRVKYILRNAECKAVISVADSMFKLSNFDVPVFAMDVQLDILPVAAPLRFCGRQDDLAYILFTSGSTGYPKGVKVGQLSFGNYITWANEYYYNNSKAYDMPLYTSVSFDFTLTGIFSPLTRGSAIYICKEDKDIYHTLKFIFSSDLKAVKITPAHIDALDSLQLWTTGIEIAIVGGEELLPHHVSILKKLNPAIRIYNEYGPTEATVACTASLVDNSNNLITIGRPVNNTRIFIVDEEMRLLPTLAAGEILISGDCLSVGYIQTEQDSEKFIEIEIDGRRERMYRSGDKGLYTANNDIVFLGRISGNEQVKIKGHRIELKEIEACLMRMGKIDRAIIVVRKINREEVIVAYYLAKEQLDEKRIKSYLGKFLPRQMVPAIIMQLERLPLNVNGKINYEGLPDPAASNNRQYIPPANEVEGKLVEIWAAILGMEKEKISVTDGFFSLGGNSLKVVQLGQKIEDTFGIAIPVAEFFDKDSINTIISNFFNASSFQVK